MIFRDVPKARIVRKPGILAPRWRVGHQRVPEGEANQRRAVLNLRPCLGRRRVILRFRQECEPAGEVLPVLGTVKASAVREAIAQAVAPNGAARGRTGAGQGVRAPRELSASTGPWRRTRLPPAVNRASKAAPVNTLKTLTGFGWRNGRLKFFTAYCVATF